MVLRATPRERADEPLRRRDGLGVTPVVAGGRCAAASDPVTGLPAGG